MPIQFSQLFAKMTSQEQAEVVTFAAFVMARRKLKPQQLTDDMSAQELMSLVTAGGSFDWLDNEEEDVYSITDGEVVEWPSA